jgi:hypothetical protein
MVGLEDTVCPLSLATPIRDRFDQLPLHLGSGGRVVVLHGFVNAGPRAFGPRPPRELTQ